MGLPSVAGLWKQPLDIAAEGREGPGAHPSVCGQVGGVGKALASPGVQARWAGQGTPIGRPTADSEASSNRAGDRGRRCVQMQRPPPFFLLNSDRSHSEFEVTSNFKTRSAEARVEMLCFGGGCRRPLILCSITEHALAVGICVKRLAFPERYKPVL